MPDIDPEYVMFSDVEAAHVQVLDSVDSLRNLVKAFTKRNKIEIENVNNLSISELVKLVGQWRAVRR